MPKKFIFFITLFSYIFISSKIENSNNNNLNNNLDRLKKISKELFENAHKNGEMGIISIINKNKLNSRDIATTLRFAVQISEKNHAKITSKLIEKVYKYKFIGYIKKNKSKSSIWNRKFEYFSKGMFAGAGAFASLVIISLTSQLILVPSIFYYFW